MSSKKIFSLTALVLLLFALLTNSCTKEYVQKDKICFERDVRPIITTHCMGSGCHNASDRESGRDYSTYEGVMRDVKAGDYRASTLYQIVAPFTGSMPPKPNDRLTTDQIKVLASWIEEGATNDTCAVSSCDTSGVIRYSVDVRPILQNNCGFSGCHGGSSPSAGISYATYSGTKVTVDNGTLVGSIQHSSGYSPMPKGGGKLPDCSIAKIKKWVANGALDN